MKRSFLIGCMMILPAAAPGQVIWDELTQGDLSDDRFAPTPMVLSPGDNFLFGIIDGDDGTGNIDRDYFHVTIPAGFVFSELQLASYASSDQAAFIGIQPGPIFPDDPDTVLPGDLLGWTLMGPPVVGMDLLPRIGINGHGFVPPLSAGTYSFWVQQTGDFTEWTGNFVVDVPEPMSALSLAFAGALLARRRR